MAKLEINQLAEILKRNKVPSDMLRAVVEEMNLLARAEANEEKPPAVKKQYVILVSDPNGFLKNHDFAGWVIQIPDDTAPICTEERLFRAAYDFNASKKGRLMPVQTIGEAIENIPAKTFKEVEAWIKTKTPVLVCRTENELPKQKGNVLRQEEESE